MEQTKLGFMSEEQRGRVLSAVSSATDAVDDGAAPTDAIVKAAREAKLTSGQAKLAALCYNVGASTSQRLSGDDVAVKAAEFAIADSDAVEAALSEGGPAVKTASTHRPDWDYRRAPYWYDEHATSIRAKAAVGGFEKAASAAKAVMESERPPLPYGERLVAASNEHRRLKAASRAAEMVVVSASRGIEAGLDKLAAYFRSPTSPNFGDVRRIAIRGLGKSAALVFDTLAERMPKGLRKAASNQWLEFSLTKSPWREIEDVITRGAFLAQTYAEKEAADVQVEAHYYGPMAEFVGVDPLTDSPLAGLATPLQGRTDFTKSAAGNFDVLGKALGGAWNSGQADRTPPATIAAAPEGSAYDEENRAIAAQSMLHGLVTSDPTIGDTARHPHDKVLASFNQLSQFAPNAAAQPLVIQPFLAKHLEQGVLDPAQITQLSSIENSLSGTR